MAENQKTIDLGTIGYTDKGTWQQGYSFVDGESGETITGYDQNDLVHTTDGIFRSLVDGNTTQPGADNETWQTWVDISPVNDSVAKVKSLLDAFQSTNPYVGFARVDGDSDPDAVTDYTYGSAQLKKSLFKHARLAWVKDGKVAYLCAPGRISKATDGTDIAIDGTMGDLMVYFEDGANFLTTSQEVNGSQMNMMALGALPCYWQDKASEHLNPFAISADYSVHGKIGDDVRSQAHCCYNKSVNGSYGAPNGLFKASYITGAGGVNLGGVSCVESIRQAQNKNADALTNRPYMGEYFRFYEVWAAMAMIECGTLAISRLNLFGTGLTPLDTVGASNFYDTAMSGNSGFKIIKSDGSVNWQNIHGYQNFIKGSSENQSLQNAINGYTYGICESLEPHRVLDGIAKAGLVGKMGDSTIFFVMDADGGVSICTDVIDVTTGEGMTACKHYYQVRDVPGCEGMSSGVMTAVVNSYTKMEFADDAKLKDGSSLAGAVAILKRSMPIYRGKGLPYRGRFEQLCGFHYIINRNADGTGFWQFKCAQRVEDVQPLTVFSNSAYEGDLNTELPLEKGLSYESRPSFSMSWNEGYVSNADYNHSLFEFTKAGGSIRTNECAYFWLYPGNNAGNGRRQAHGSVVGCNAYAWNPPASLRAATCSNHAGNGYDSYAGAFAVPNIDSNN